MSRSPILHVELLTPDVPDEALLADLSWMLSGASSYFDLKGFFFAASHMKKGKSLGALFEEVMSVNGTFELELGVILPDLFPNLEGKPEYALSVRVDKSSQTVCFSNVMSRLRFQMEHDYLHALLPRRALPKVREGEVDFIPADASVELLRTFATARYVVEGATAEEALETHCERCIHDLIERLNHILKTMPFVDSAPGRVYSVAYSRASLPYFYFILKGQSEDNLGHGWISPHVGRSMLNPPSLGSEQTKELREYLDGTKEIDEIDAILHSAQTFMDGGVLEYTLLLTVIAAEVATQRFVYDRLRATSVSKNKLDAAMKGDLTYSLMLNVVLFSLTPENNKPDSSLVGKINRARSLRNAYMHEGEVPNDPHEISDLLATTRTFIDYIRQLQTTVSGGSANSNKQS